MHWENKARLDMMRESIERKIFEANQSLLSTPSRWRDVNHLLIEAQKSNSIQNQSNSNFNFIESLGISTNTIQVNKKQVFVLTPFHEIHDETFEIIRRTCLMAGLECLRGDEKYVEGNILKHIISEILGSSLVIANIDGRNSNVYYELGIVHALGKPSILISSNIDEVPFDIKSQRIIVYSDLKVLENRLLSAIASFAINA
ncbi:MAG: hypothetical protein IPL96_03720 [Holophagaceae bacterium]|nr:hypothetical protein [Holophagaceae bacterium]